MKRDVNHVFLIFCVIFFSSCSSVYYLEIETQQPAKITFPVPRAKVVVVNNAVSQPDSIGYISYEFEHKKENELAKPTSNEDDSLLFYTNIIKPKDIISSSLSRSKVEFDTIATELKLQPHFVDSMVWLGIRNFSKIIGKAEFFSDVLMFEDTLRKDNEWLKVKPISSEDVADICNLVDADVIISIERLLFTFGQTLLERSFPNYSGIQNSATSIANISCSIYMMEREKPLTVFALRDTLTERNFIFEGGMDSLFLYQSIAEAFIKASAINISAKLAESFTPNWRMSYRAIYTDQTSRMKEALIFVKKDDWKNAGMLYELLFNNETNIKTKARLANNIAVSYEMQDQFDTAFEWLEKSVGFYAETNPKKLKEERDWITTYKNELNERIQFNNILDIQFGEK